MPIHEYQKKLLAIQLIIDTLNTAELKNIETYIKNRRQQESETQN